MQPVEKLIYDENSSVRFNTIKRLEPELKWIKLLQSASPLGFNDNIYQEGNISKMPDFDVLSLFSFSATSGKLIYDENSSVRFNTIKRLEPELKWIKLLQSASPLGFNDNIYQEGNISKIPDFDVLSLLEIRKTYTQISW